MYILINTAKNVVEIVFTLEVYREEVRGPYRKNQESLKLLQHKTRPRVSIRTDMGLRSHILKKREIDQLHRGRHIKTQEIEFGRSPARWSKSGETGITSHALLRLHPCPVQP